jgi:hypothetical protein
VLVLVLTWHVNRTSRILLEEIFGHEQGMKRSVIPHDIFHRPLATIDKAHDVAKEILEREHPKVLYRPPTS